MGIRYLRKHNYFNSSEPNTTLATNETIQGDDVIGFTHPRDLAEAAFPSSIKPWPVPIADYAAELAEFVAVCTAATNDAGFRAALNVLRAHHCKAKVDDVPEAKRDAFKTFVKEQVSQYDDVNRFLDPSGGEGAWRS